MLMLPMQVDKVVPHGPELSQGSRRIVDNGPASALHRDLPFDDKRPTIRLCEGGTDPGSGVSWSGWASHRNSWVRTTVDFTATASTATIFLEFNQARGSQTCPSNFAIDYFDHVTLQTQ